MNIPVTARPVTAIIVTYQSARTIGRALAAARRCHDAGLLDLVVVDNASRDATREILAREAGWGTLIALMHRGKPVVGIIHDILNNITWPRAVPAASPRRALAQASIACTNVANLLLVRARAFVPILLVLAFAAPGRAASPDTRAAAGRRCRRAPGSRAPP